MGDYLGLTPGTSLSKNNLKISLSRDHFRNINSIQYCRTYFLRRHSQYITLGTSLTVTFTLYRVAGNTIWTYLSGPHSQDIAIRTPLSGHHFQDSTLDFTIRDMESLQDCQTSLLGHHIRKSLFRDVCSLHDCRTSKLLHRSQDRTSLSGHHS